MASPDGVVIGVHGTSMPFAAPGLRDRPGMLDRTELLDRTRELLVGAAAWQADPHRAAVDGDRAIELAELADSPELHALALVQAGCAEVVLGGDAVGREMTQHGLSIAEQSGDAELVRSCRAEIATMQLLTGRPAEAADIALAALSGDGAPDAPSRGTLLEQAIAGLTHAGRWSEVAALVKAEDEQTLPGPARIQHAQLAGLRGAFTKARTELELLADGDAGNDPRCSAAEAWLAFGRDRPAQQQRAALRGLRSTRPVSAALVNELVFLAVAGLAREGRRFRHPDAAQRDVATVLSLLCDDPGGMPTSGAWAAAAHAEAESIEHPTPAGWRTALAAWDDIDGWPHPRCYLQCRLALVIDDAVEAAELVTAAWERARALGSTPLQRIAQSTAARLGLDPGRLDDTGPRNLTPREQEVLDHIVDGATNRAIASRLGISEKTASVHVSNLLRKLGAASRTEAALLAKRMQ